MKEIVILLGMDTDTIALLALVISFLTFIFYVIYSIWKACRDIANSKEQLAISYETMRRGTRPFVDTDLVYDDSPPNVNKQLQNNQPKANQNRTKISLTVSGSSAFITSISTAIGVGDYEWIVNRSRKTMSLHPGASRNYTIKNTHGNPIDDKEDISKMITASRDAGGKIFLKIRITYESLHDGEEYTYDAKYIMNSNNEWEYVGDNPHVQSKPEPKSEPSDGLLKRLLKRLFLFLKPLPPFA